MLCTVCLSSFTFILCTFLRFLLIFVLLPSGGSRKKYLGGPGPSSFGRQPRLSEITIEPISGVAKNLGARVYARNVAPSSEHWTLKARGSRRREAWVLGRGCPLQYPPRPQPTRGSGGASWALPAGSGAKPRPPTHYRYISGPQNPSSRNNALRNQSKIWGAWARFGGACAPLAPA